MSHKKVTVIGAGNVGATLAQRIVEANLANVMLIDVVEGLAEGKALDIMQSAPILGFESHIEGTNDFTRSAGSAVIVVTAGLARKPGMSRDDLLHKNAEIVREVVGVTAPLSPEAVIIVVTNPLDAMCYVAQVASGFPHNRVIGMAGELDGARFIHFVREQVHTPVATMKTMVLGTHGDDMVPLVRFSVANAKKVRSLVTPEVLNDIVEKTKKGGAQVVSLLKTGSAYYAPSAATFAMVKSILTNARDLFCCSVYAGGAYGITDTYCGLPVRLGTHGVAEIVELELNDDEQAMLDASAKAIKEHIDKIRE